MCCQAHGYLAVLLSIPGSEAWVLALRSAARRRRESIFDLLTCRAQIVSAPRENGFSAAQAATPLPLPLACSRMNSIKLAAARV
jgi:hypothetical protein